MQYPNRIRELRESKRLTLEELAAAANISVSYLSRLETGERNLAMKTLSKVASALDVSESAVIAVGAREETGSTFRLRGDPAQLVPYRGPPQAQYDKKQIPIFSGAQGGKGHELIEENAVEFLAPPEDLVNVKGAYGILVSGESMVPAFRPGDIAWVHPHLPPERDTEVVLYHTPAEAYAEAIIKTLVSWTPKDWKLRQYNPPLDLTESRADWPKCHRIVGKKAKR